MMAFNLSSNSWHYKLANFGEQRTGWQEDDICHYVRCVLVGGFWFAMVAAFLAGMAGAYVVAVVNLIGFMFFGYAMMEWAGLLLAITALFAIVVVGAVYRVRQREYERERAEPGFIELSIRKFKDKTCTKITFTE